MNAFGGPNGLLAPSHAMAGSRRILGAVNGPKPKCVASFQGRVSERCSRPQSQAARPVRRQGTSELFDRTQNSSFSFRFSFHLFIPFFYLLCNYLVSFIIHEHSLRKTVARWDVCLPECSPNSMFHPLHFPFMLELHQVFSSEYPCWLTVGYFLGRRWMAPQPGSTGWDPFSWLCQRFWVRPAGQPVGSWCITCLIWVEELQPVIG